MATNLEIDKKLLAEALKVGQLPTEKATVDEALSEFIRRRKQLESLKLLDTISIDID